MEWASCYAPEDGHAPARYSHGKLPETNDSSTVLPSAGAFGDADPETGTESSSDPSTEAEEPAARTPKPAEFDDTCDDDVEVGNDPWEPYPSDTDAETYEWFRQHKPETYEEDYRKWRADIEMYESCGYW